ncbi:GNAT family N-acetyltransferase [Fulvimarina endophytica]|uniref:GNAT family N-acetyltransferase n=1 Tax=Fulvimarina endophytica TaxID=2293836 RepID=A0A371X9Z6_9HYPH|nr:GNAT family N-acetyltransferase [Fulvimarina endophytica]RFC66050.1 GNAT family N-acetyltransferase [Fulvimarina endophytica]
MNDRGGALALSPKLEILAAPGAARKDLDEAASRVIDLFLQREAEFGVHPSVTIHYPDLKDTSAQSFLADAADHVSRQADEMARNGRPAERIVVLTTYGDVVAPSFQAAGYAIIPIDMPAGPDHTCAFVLGPGEPSEGMRTLYVEAVNEADEKIRPTFILTFKDETGDLLAGACGTIHERDGRRYAYLATLTTSARADKGTGTMLAGELMRFLREAGVCTVHLGTQTAAAFYRKVGFGVDHRLVRGMRTRMVDRCELRDDLVMLSMKL